MAISENGPLVLRQYYIRKRLYYQYLNFRGVSSAPCEVPASVYSEPIFLPALSGTLCCIANDVSILRMRIPAVIFLLVQTALILSCDLQNEVSDVDPVLGVKCFASRRASLPPGTQYEGIEKAAEDQLTIRIMNGVEVVTLDCGLNPDGTLQVGGK